MEKVLISVGITEEKKINKIKFKKMEKVRPWPILGSRMAKEQNSVTYSGPLINSCSGS